MEIGKGNKVIFLVHNATPCGREIVDVDEIKFDECEICIYDCKIYDKYLNKDKEEKNE